MTPTLHRKWAREFLERADAAHQPTMKRRYLRLAVDNTVCAMKLDATSNWPAKEGQSRND